MNYDIELNANDSSTLETQYAFTQGDYGQIQFSIRVKANGVYVTNAQRAYIVFTLPNGYVVTGSDMTKNVATYTYPFQGSELQVPGKILADVKLVYTDGQISSNKFSFICRYDPLHDKSFNAGPYISQLQTFIDEAQLKINYLQTLIETLQPDVGGTALTRSDLHNTRDVVTAGLKTIDANMAQNILLRGDVTNQYENDTNKLAGAASVYGLKGTVDTLNSNLSVMGTDYSISPPSYVSCETGITTEIVGIVLSSGTYVISAGLKWSDAARGGGRRIHIRQGEYYNSLSIASDGSDDFANDVAPMEQSATGIAILPTGSYIKLWATQTSGSNLSVESTAYLKAVRIK